MALVATVNKRYPLGDDEYIVGTVAFDSTYPSGGEALTLSQLVCESVRYMAFSGTGAGGYVPVFDKTNTKIQLFYGDNNNAADGPLIENATADVSALTAVAFVAVVS